MAVTIKNQPPTQQQKEAFSVSMGLVTRAEFVDGMPKYLNKYEEVSDTVLYRGIALPDSADADEAWQIQKIVINEDDSVTRLYAQRSEEFAYAWSERANYTYLEL